MTTMEKLLIANLAGEAVLAGLLVRSHNKLIDERKEYLSCPKFHCYMGFRKKKEERKWREKIKKDEEYLKQFRNET